MKEYFRLFLKTGIVIFCLWHMAAVGFYSIPSDSRDRFSIWLRDTINPHVAPYLLMTSQWQQWNLFSPNPLRRVTFYSIDTYQTDRWSEIAYIDNEMYNRFRHAARFKMYGQLFAEENDALLPIRENATWQLCEELNVPAGTPIRVWRDVTVIPYISPSPPKEWWEQWIPRFEPNLAVDTICPSRS